MDQIKIVIDTDIGYKSLSIPEKIILPIEKGRFGIFSYEQHPTDPMSIEKLKIESAGENRIKINMRGTGRLHVENFPDPRIGGTKVEVEAEMVVEDVKLCIQAPVITHLDLPSIPNFADDFFRDILNKYLLKKLADELKIDIRETLDDARGRINQPITFNIKVDKASLNYVLQLGLEPIEPELEIKDQGIRLKLSLTLKPVIALLKEANVYMPVSPT